MDISLSYGRRAQGDAASRTLARIFERPFAHSTAMPISPRTIRTAMTASAVLSRRVTGKGMVDFGPKGRIPRPSRRQRFHSSHGVLWWTPMSSSGWLESEWTKARWGTSGSATVGERDRLHLHRKQLRVHCALRHFVHGPGHHDRETVADLDADLAARHVHGDVAIDEA